MRIVLSWTECESATHIGVKRRLLAMKRRRSEPLGSPDSDPWELDVEGAAAEMAASIALQQRWLQDIRICLDVKPPDVGEDVEVRWTHHANGHLAVFDHDHADRKFVLVTGRMPTFNVVGIIEGCEAKTERFRTRTPRGTLAYWIPQAALVPIP